MDDRLSMDLGEVLSSGGDERIVLHANGLNKYGCSPVPQPEVLGLGSCTSSSSSPEAFEAVANVFARIRAGETEVPTVFGEIRNTLRQLLLLSEDVAITLAPSGTDAEMLATAIAAGMDDRRIVNIVVGPLEVGSGTLNAAACRYYDPLTPSGQNVSVGSPINAELAKRVSTTTVDIRDANGGIRNTDQVDAELLQIVALCADDDTQFILHVVTHSKTGLTAPSPGFVRKLKEDLGEQLTVVVDAAQGRIGRRQLNELVGDGCHVIWTGSKFIGGPPFVGALFSPLNSIEDDFRFPQEFDQFFTRDELPSHWQHACQDFSERENMGASLRWIAAVEELNAFYRTSAVARCEIIQQFEEMVPHVLCESKTMALLSSTTMDEIRWTKAPEIESFTTVYSFCVEPPKHQRFTREQLNEMHSALIENGFHLGQPVRLCEEKWALRIAMSMPLIVRLTQDEAWGDTLPDRLDYFRDRLRSLVAKVDTIAMAMTSKSELSV